MKTQLPPLLLVMGFCICLSSCGLANRATSGYGSDSVAAETSRSLNNVQKKLYQAHEEWRGTPYLLGGSNLNGVDCSSFIQNVFNEQFKVGLPRNTREQLQEGSGVRRNSIRPGDLVFFRTGPKTLHVGIAMNRHEFLHASTSSGVMISSLNEHYWSSRFLTIRRVL